jgi:hypothetical protein
MTHKKFWETYIFPIQRYFRSRRAAVYFKMMPDFKEKNVLDVGGSYYFWQQANEMRPKHITLLNINDFDPFHSVTGDEYQVKQVLYDGVTMPFPDKHFDVAFSNSVIEHVPVAMRENFISEMRRVSKHYFVQTPAFGFPMEMHFFTPFLHWLPRKIGRYASLLSIYRLVYKHKPDACYALYDEVNLLKRKELQNYDSSMQIVVERFLGMPKSFVAFGQGS